MINTILPKEEENGSGNEEKNDGNNVSGDINLVHGIVSLRKKGRKRIITSIMNG